jgi:acyl carrier protein
MIEKPTTPSGLVPSEEEVEEIIIGALAAAQQKPINGVRSTLLEAGPAMPLDSLETVEIMLELEERFAVRFRDEQETCVAFQSVQTLVKLVRELVADEAKGGAG